MKKSISIFVFFLMVLSTYAQDDAPYKIFRLYSPRWGHFYTISANESDRAIANDGYTYEGAEGMAYKDKMIGTVPFYRLRHTSNGQHFYTTNKSERDRAIANDGFISEGIACYVYESAGTGRIPLYRLRNTSTGDHFYVANKAGRDIAISRDGCISEGIACYVMKQ